MSTSAPGIVRGPLLATCVALLLVPALSAPAGAQEGTTLEETEVELSGYLQLQAETSSCSDFPVEPSSACGEQVPGLDAFLRRARLAAGVTVTDRIDGKIEADVTAAGASVRDAWGRLTFGPGARLQIGRFKRPFDGFALTSSSRVLTIERDLDIPGVPGARTASLNGFTSAFRLSDRDIGVMLTGATGDGLAYRAGVFNGQPASAGEDRNAGKQLIVRGQYSFRMEDDLPLSLAVAVARTDLPFTGAEGEIATEYFSDVELWAELGDFGGGPHVQAGLVFGENPLQNRAGAALPPGGGAPVTGDFARSAAWQVIGAYRVNARGDDGPGGADAWVAAVEPVLRVGRAEPNRDVPDDEVWGFTPGVNLYFAERNRLALDWDVAVFSDDTDAASSFRAQYQLWF